MSELKKKYLSALTYIYFVSLFFDIRTGNIGLILLLIGSASTISFQKFKIAILENKFAFLLVLYFVVNVIGLIHTSDLNSGWFAIEKKISFLVAPIIIVTAYCNFTKTDVSNLLANWGWLSIFSSLILLVVASFKFLILRDDRAFFFEDFSPISYVYYSLYFVVTVSFLVSNLLQKKPSSLITAIMMLMYSLGFLVVVSSKIGIISFLICSVLSLILNAPVRHAGIILTGLIIFLAVALSLHKTTRSRFAVLIENLTVIKAEKVSDYQAFTGLNLRLLFWKFSVQEVIDRKSVFVGAGTGDAQHWIDEGYKKHGLDEYGYRGFDPHNQWVFTFVQFGLIGVLVLFLLFLNSARAAIKERAWMLLFFLIVCLLYSLTESILESNKGIIFFAVLYSLLILLIKKTKTAF